MKKKSFVKSTLGHKNKYLITDNVRFKLFYYLCTAFRHNVSMNAGDTPDSCFCRDNEYKLNIQTK